MGMDDPTCKKTAVGWFDLHILNGYIPKELWRWVRCWKLSLNMETREERGGNDDGVVLA